MQELIEQLKEKAGINDEQAKIAIEAVKDYVKSKVPPMLAGTIDNFFTGMGSLPKKDNDDFMP